MIAFTKMQANAQLAQLSMLSVTPALERINVPLALMRLSSLMSEYARLVALPCNTAKNVHQLLFVLNVNQALSLPLINVVISATKLF